MTSIARFTVTALVAGFLFAALSPARADDDGLDDRSEPASVEHDQGAGYVLRNTRGRRTGTMEQDATGQWIMRDTAGRRTGTIDRR